MEFDPKQIDVLKQVTNPAHPQLWSDVLCGDTVRIAATLSLIAHVEKRPQLSRGGNRSELVRASGHTMYRKEDLLRIRELLESKGTFRIARNRSGLLQTTLADENPNMHRNLWITDLVRTLSLLESKEERNHTLAIIARHYLSPVERDTICDLVRNPQKYRSSDIRQGVAHLFQLNSHSEPERDPTWKNNKRLESHGLALGAFCQSLGGMDDAQQKDVAEAIVLLTGFFAAIEYPTAPSAGCWEEVVFDGGMTWDTEAIRVGLGEVQILIGVSDTRNLLIDAAKRIHKRDGLELTPIISSDRRIADLMDVGARRIRSTYFSESEQRPIDAALVFVANSTIEPYPTRDNITNTLARSILLFRLEKELLRNSGMLRYAPFVVGGKTVSDGYLGCNYWTCLDQQGYLSAGSSFGSTDTSDEAAYLQRASVFDAGKEAEWFMVSDLAVAWLKVAMRFRETGEAQMEGICRERAHNALTVSLSRIVGDGDYKSNGLDAPAWKIPEAFEWIRVRINGQLHERLVPGVNTPLAWATASLKDCLGAFIKDAS